MWHFGLAPGYFVEPSIAVKARVGIQNYRIDFLILVHRVCPPRSANALSNTGWLYLLAVDACKNS